MTRFFVNTRDNSQFSIAKSIIDNSPIRDRFCLFKRGENNDYAVISSPSDLHKQCDKTIIIGNTIPIFNRFSFDTIKALGTKEGMFLISYELTYKEMMDLKSVIPDGFDMLIPIYGHIPLMRTKNCVRLTCGDCNHSGKESIVKIKDRKNIELFVKCDCKKCENIIYNAYPLSLHNYLDKILDYNLYIDFTVENDETLSSVMSFYEKILSGKTEVFPYEKFTTGHFNKAVL